MVPVGAGDKPLVWLHGETRSTPKAVIDVCKRRLAEYERLR